MNPGKLPQLSALLGEGRKGIGRYERLKFAIGVLPPRFPGEKPLGIQGNDSRDRMPMVDDGENLPGLDPLELGAELRLELGYGYSLHVTSI